VLGDPIDRFFDPIGQLQTIPRMEPLELFLRQMLNPGRFILKLTAPLATLDGRFQSLFKIVAHGLGITALSAFGAPALRDRIAGNRIRQATRVPRMSGLIRRLTSGNGGHARTGIRFDRDIVIILGLGRFLLSRWLGLVLLKVLQQVAERTQRLASFRHRLTDRGRRLVSGNSGLVRSRLVMSFASFAPTTITPLIAIPSRATIPLPLATATTLRSVAATLVRAPTTPRIISTARRTADRLTAAATLLATARFGRRTLAALVPTLAVATLCLALARFAAGLPLIPATGAPLSPALLPAATA
jgi:hypothetical protein